MKLGFTFSFPCSQLGLNNAILVRWTKGFSVCGVEGKNVANLLQEAITRKGCKVECTAVVNDTVGTLASCALEEPRTAIGLIVGTGTNAAYIEKTENIKSLKQKMKESNMVINTEWGAFGEKGEIDDISTVYDKNLDSNSLRPGAQLFEKMISGMYLGELVRLILVDMCKKNLIFGGTLPEKLKEPNGFHTKYMSETERDPDHLYYGTNYMLTTDIGAKIVDPTDACIVRKVCLAVAKRAANLTGVGIAALLRQMKRPVVIIGVDGSLYRFHPKFHTMMTEMIDKLKPEDTTFLLKTSTDGSGRGAAAIVAAS